MKGRTVLIAGGGLVVLLTAWLGYWYGYGGRAASLAESDDPDDRIEAVKELSGKWGPLARKTLTRLPDDPDDKVARAAVRAIGERRDDASRQTLEQVLASQRRPAVRAEAASALGKYPETSVTVLTGVLERDPEPVVREKAATGLAARRDVSAVGALVDRLEFDPDVKVRKSSYLALRRILKVRFIYDAEAPLHERRRRVAVIRSILRRYKLL